MQTAANYVFPKPRELSSTGWWVIGAITGLAGGVALYYSNKNNKKAELIRSTPLSGAGDLEAILEDHGHGAERWPYVKLEGVTSSDSPILGPLSHRECVLYVTEKIRHYESMSKIKNKTKKSRKTKVNPLEEKSKGSESSYEKDVWSKGKETLAGKREEAVTYVQDGSGRCLVTYPRGGGGHLELVTTYDEFTESDRRSESGTSKRTLGVQEVERILPLGHRILVLGEISRDSVTGGIRIHAPRTTGTFDKRSQLRPYVLTSLTEDDLLYDVEQTVRMLLGGGVVASVLAVAAIVKGVVVHSRNVYY